MIIFFLIYTFDPHLKANQRMKVVEKNYIVPHGHDQSLQTPLRGLGLGGKTLIQ